jgi:hypothetical protein
MFLFLKVLSFFADLAGSLAVDVLMRKVWRSANATKPRPEPQKPAAPSDFERGRAQAEARFARINRGLALRS